MKFAESEYKRKSNFKTSTDKKNKKLESKPEWFNQEIEENTASDLEIKALEERIGSR